MFPIVNGERRPFILGAPRAHPMPNLGFWGIADVDESHQRVLDHVQCLTDEAEKLLMAALQAGADIPTDIRQQIEEQAGQHHAWGWIRWMLYAIPCRSICWFDNYSQAAASALRELMKSVTAHRGHESIERTGGSGAATEASDPPDQPRPLNDKQKKALAFIMKKSNVRVTAPQIATHVDTTEETVRRWCQEKGPGPLYARGVRNDHDNEGYYWQKPT